MQSRGVEFKATLALCLLALGVLSCKPTQKHAAADEPKPPEPANTSQSTGLRAQTNSGTPAEKLEVPEGQVAYVSEAFGPDEARSVIERAGETAEEIAAGLQKDHAIALRARALLSKALGSPHWLEAVRVSPGDSFDEEVAKVAVSNILDHVVGKILMCEDGFFLKVISTNTPPPQILTKEGLERLKAAEAAAAPIRPAGARPTLSQRIEAMQGTTGGVGAATNKVVSFLVQFKHPVNVSITSRKLSEAEGLNGAKWNGYVETFARGPFRAFADGKWTPWRDTDAGLYVKFWIDKVESRWYSNLQVSHVAVTGGIGDQGPFVVHRFESIGDRTKLPPL